MATVSKQARKTKIFKKITIRIVMFVLATLGFCYQSYVTCDEYFKYPTRTIVSIDNWQSKTLPPKTVLCLSFKFREGENVKDLFTRLSDTTFIENAKIKKSEEESFEKFKDDPLEVLWYGKRYQQLNSTNVRTLFDIDKFVLLRRYCISLTPLGTLFNGTPAYSPVDLYTVNNEKTNVLYEIIIRTNIQNITGTNSEMLLYLIPYSSDAEGIQNVASLKVCKENAGKCEFIMTYSVKTTKFAPPPYNTDCMNYQSVGFSSRENCLSRCLSHLSTRGGRILESSVLEKRKLENSSLLLSSWTNMQSSQLLFSECNRTCSRRDCVVDSLVPQIVTLHNLQDKVGELKKIQLKLLPPNDQIFTVSSVEKVSLLDFIVYMVSCLSFWYGLCPLDAAKSGKKINQLFKTSQNQYESNNIRNYQTGRSSNRTYKTIIFCVVTLGFSYQSIQICHEYLKYPTTTFVSVRDTSGMVSPRIIIAYPFHPGWIGRTVEDVFSEFYRNDSIVFSKIRESETTMLTLDWLRNKSVVPTRIVDLKSFLKSSFYCISVAPKYPIKYSTADLYTTPEKVFEARVVTDVKEVKKTFGLPALFLTSYNADFEGLRLTPPAVVCNGTCMAFMTYSVKISQLAPPPYDTNCHNYTRNGFTSRENCLSECLTQFTQVRGMIIESNVIPREKYQNSSLTIIPWYFRSLEVNKKQVSTQFIQQEAKLLDKYQKRGINVTEDFFRRLQAILPSYKRHFYECRKSCKRPDCYTESIVPEMIRDRSFGRKRKLYGMQVGVYPAPSPPVTATSQPKNDFLSVIIYLISCMSFWYGICLTKFGTYVDIATEKIVVYLRGMGVLKTHHNRQRHKKSKLQVFGKVLFRLLTFLTVLVSFTYHSSLICQEYFAYPTTTLVSLVNALPMTTTPKIVITRILDDGPDRRVELSGVAIQDAFAFLNESTVIMSREIRTGGEKYSGSDVIVMEKFFKTGSYLIVLSPKDAIVYSSNDLYKFSNPMYSVKIRTNIMADIASFFVTLVPYSSDLEGVSPSVPVYFACRSKRCTLMVSYSIRITQLAPPPYDSNCRNYRHSGISSREKCLSQCLNEFTEKHGMLLETNVIPKRKYENSPFILMPHFMRSLVSNRTRVTSDFIGSKRGSKIPIKIKSAVNLKDHYDRLADMFPNYESYWYTCNSSCSQPDCYTESLISHKESVTEHRHSTDPNGTMTISVYPPRDQVVIVKSEAKQSLLDFLVYMATCLSFWFGWCPLDAYKLNPFRYVKTVKKKTRKILKAHKVKDIHGRKKVHPVPLVVVDEETQEGDFSNDWNIKWHTLTPKSDNAGSAKYNQPLFVKRYSKKE